MSGLTRLVDGRLVPIAATWNLDAGHTSAAFGVRHLLTLMRGRFREMSGTVIIADDPTESTVEVTISAASIDTANAGADDTLRGERFLDVETHPDIRFESTTVTAAENGQWTVSGDLTIRGVTHPVDLATEFLGAVTSPLGDKKKMSFVATTTIDREDYGLTVTAESPDTKGVWIVGRTIEITLDIEADLNE
jgi:polyisoprenoid-binding protein YceI